MVRARRPRSTACSTRTFRPHRCIRSIGTACRRWVAASTAGGHGPAGRPDTADPCAVPRARVATWPARR